eukprot:s2726_g7.t1
MSYVDDREVEAPSSAVLQTAIAATRQFNADEGLTTVIEADKTFCWHACEPNSAIQWGADPMPRQTQWSLLGTDLSASSARVQVKSHDRRRAFLNVVRRLACLPISSFDRQLPHGASAIGKLIYGQESHSMSEQEGRSLRTAALANLWENKLRRCPEAAIAICMPGHRHDPELALTYSSFATIRRFVQNPTARQQWLDTWRAVCFSGRVSGQGPVLEFRRRLKKIGWQALDGLRFHVPGPLGDVEVHFLDTEKPIFLHVLRDSLRRMLMTRAAKRRPDFHEADLADFDITRSVFTKQQFDKWTPLRKSLQTLLSGAMFTQRVRFLQGKVDSAECPFCHSEDENVMHVLWKCTAWQHIRDELSPFNLNPNEWPAAMSLCGYFVPHVPTAPRPDEWPRIQVVLARIIQARTQHLTDNNLFDEKPAKPQPPAPDDAGIDPQRGPPRSRKFPLFRPFTNDNDCTNTTPLAFHAHTPVFNTGSTGAWNWGKEAWFALRKYWSAVRVTWPKDPSTEECTPWIVAAIDAALLCGTHVFARADGNCDLICLFQTFKRASRRFGHLCKNPCFERDGPDSKRLRPLWVPQVDSLQFSVRLVAPEQVPESNASGPLCLSYGDKQAALQAQRRFDKLREHNQKAHQSPLHVIRAHQLLERPSCVVCGVERRKGHWLRLAATQCPKHDPDTCATLIRQEDLHIQAKLDDIEKLKAQKTVRPDVAADFDRKRKEKAKLESEMSLAEALTLPYKRKLRVLALLGYSSVKAAQNALDQS